MIVRYYWPSCDFRQNEQDATPVDAFWVEATHEEAVQSVFPILNPEAQAESERLASEFEHVAETISQPPRPFGFLVARDLSSIDPFVIHYPFHQLWNAYSPFVSISERTITSLHQLAELSVEADP